MRWILILVCAAVCLAADVKQIFPAGAKPVGPFSPGIQAGDYVYVSGQGARKPADNSLAAEADAQTRQVIENLRVILDAAGHGLNDVVYAQVYISNMNAYDAVDAALKSAFPNNPARSFIIVQRLPTDTPVEVSVVASKKPGPRVYMPGVLGKLSTTNRVPSEPAKQAELAFDSSAAWLKSKKLKLSDLDYVTIYHTADLPRDTVEQIANKRLKTSTKRAFIETAALPSHANIEITGVANAPDLIFTSAHTGTTEEVLNGLKQDAGGSMDKVVAANVYLDDIDNFAVMNKAYAGFFGAVPPTRTTVQPVKGAKANTITLIAVK